jgi:hypothetical protein
MRIKPASRMATAPKMKKMVPCGISAKSVESMFISNKARHGGDSAAQRVGLPLKIARSLGTYSEK